MKRLIFEIFLPRKTKQNISMDLQNIFGLFNYFSHTWLIAIYNLSAFAVGFMLLLFSYYSDPDLVVNLAEVAPWEDAVGEAYKHKRLK